MSKRKNLSRAEIVRQRRSRSQKKMGSAHNPHRNLPPITARGVVNDYAFEQRKKVGKRRYNAAFNPTHPKSATRSMTRGRLRIGWRLLSFLLVAVLSAGLYFSWSMPQLRVGSAHVTGNQRIPADEIDSALGLSGYPIFVLMPEQIETLTLKNFHELASVDVDLSLPNIVNISVTERQPILLWQQDGEYTLIDENGFAFRPRGTTQGLIIVQALEPLPEPPETEEGLPLAFIPADLVVAIKTLSKQIPADTPILYHPVSGLSWNDPRGWQVVLGAADDDTALKVRVYQAMVEWVAEHSIQPDVINVATPSAPFYRLEHSQVEVQ